MNQIESRGLTRCYVQMIDYQMTRIITEKVNESFDTREEVRWSVEVTGLLNSLTFSFLTVSAVPLILPCADISQTLVVRLMMTHSSFISPNTRPMHLTLEPLSSAYSSIVKITKITRRLNTKSMSLSFSYKLLPEIKDKIKVNMIEKHSLNDEELKRKLGPKSKKTIQELDLERSQPNNAI